MIINTNIAGTGETPLAKSINRPGSKLSRPLDNPSEMAGVTTLNSQADRLAASAGPDIEDAGAACENAQLVRTGILNQSAAALKAQANLSPETVLSLLQE